MEQTIIFASLGVALILFIWGKPRYDVVCYWFLMVLSIGASVAFLTHISLKSNMVVMRVEGYPFGDYRKLGLHLRY